MDSLSLFGLDGELVVGAGALAHFTLSGLGIGVVKNEEDGPAHGLGVVVDLSLDEALLVVSEWDEEFSIVGDHRPSLLSESICPQ